MEGKPGNISETVLGTSSGKQPNHLEMYKIEKRKKRF